MINNVMIVSGVHRATQPYIYIYIYSPPNSPPIRKSTFCWKLIPGMGEPGGLPSMWSHRVRHN